MNKTKQATLKISDISIDGGTQQRENINTEIVAEYAEAMRCGAQFPPVIVFHDGVSNWLADGFHRFHARREVPALEIVAEIHTGTQRDAVLYSTGANNTHGQRLSNADKRKAVGIMLADKEWSQWSDHQIAKHCKVTQPFVSQRRKELITVITPAPKPAPVIEAAKATKAPDNVVALSEEHESVVENYELEEAREAIRTLASENDNLKDRLAIGSVDEPEEAKATVLRTMEELREQVRCLEIENAAIKSSRDYFQSENAELKKQVAYWRKQAEKAA